MHPSVRRSRRELFRFTLTLAVFAATVVFGLIWLVLLFI
jgi:hypothetical protein